VGRSILLSGGAAAKQTEVRPNPCAGERDPCAIAQTKRAAAFAAAFLNSSFRDGPQDQTRNLEIPGSVLRTAPE
jgi:hypothetical protein